jgi:prevent-host-death family protein
MRAGQCGRPNPGWMMRNISITTLKKRFSRLVEDMTAGEEIVITKRGKPVARLCPLAAPPQRRQLGGLEGKIQIPDDFDRLCEEEIRRLFEEGC